MKPIHEAWRWLAYFVSLMGTMVVVFYAIFQMSVMIRYSFVDIRTFLFVYLVIVWFSVAVHEMGHALAALLVRFQVYIIAMWPLILSLTPRKWQWSVNQQSVLMGYVLALPADKHYLVQRYTVYTLGGPLFTLMLAIVTGTIFISMLFELDVVFPNPYHDVTWKYRLCYYSGFCAVVNVHVFFVTLIPNYYAKDHPNDGAILLALWTDREIPHSFDKTRDLKLHVLAQQMIHGLRPKEWDRATLMDCLGSQPSGTVNDVAVYRMAYYYFHDIGGNTVAETLLQLAVDAEQGNKYEPAPSTTLESIYFHAMFRHDGVQGWERLNELKVNNDADMPTLLRAKAALHFLDGQYQQAHELCNEALQLLRVSSDIGGSLAEADWLHAIIDRCNAARQNLPS